MQHSGALFSCDVVNTEVALHKLATCQGVTLHHSMRAGTGSSSPCYPLLNAGEEVAEDGWRMDVTQVQGSQVLNADLSDTPPPQNE